MDVAVSDEVTVTEVQPMNGTHTICACLPGMITVPHKEHESSFGPGPADDASEYAKPVMPLTEVRSNNSSVEGASQEKEPESRDRQRRCYCVRRVWQTIEQQEAEASSLPLLAYREPAQCCTASCCSVLLAVIAGILLSVSYALEEIVVPYRYTDAKKAFTVDKDMEGPVLVWYDIPNILLNHKYAVRSKDKYLWKGFLVSEYQCDSAETLEDARWRRPQSPSFNALLQNANANKFRPCGLVALAMYTDSFKIYTSGGSLIDIDESDLAIETDNDIYAEKVLPTGNSTAPSAFTVDGAPSWLATANLFERFKVWYRTPVSPHVRQLYGRIPGGLTAGEYSLNFTLNDPVFEVKWGVAEKRIVFSESKTLGSFGACRFLGVICALGAALEAVISVAFLVVGLRPKGSPRTVPVQEYATLPD